MTGNGCRGARAELIRNGRVFMTYSASATNEYCSVGPRTAGENGPRAERLRAPWARVLTSSGRRACDGDRRGVDSAEEVRHGAAVEMRAPVVRLHGRTERTAREVLQRSLQTGRTEDRASLRLPAPAVPVRGSDGGQTGVRRGSDRGRIARRGIAPDSQSARFLPPSASSGVADPAVGRSELGFGSRRPGGPSLVILFET